MSDDAYTTQPYTQWFETLPSGDTARLTISPRPGSSRVTLYWNQECHSERSFPTVETAEAWGSELRTIVMQDALAGALLGYDADTVTRLTDAVPST